MFWSLGFITLFIVAVFAIPPLIQRNSAQVVSPMTQSVAHIKEEVKDTTSFSPKNPTIEQIFNSDHFWTATISAQRKRVMIIIRMKRFGVTTEIMIRAKGKKGIPKATSVNRIRT